MEETQKLKYCFGLERELAEDIIFQEILPRLPIKSIIRFKSVCKTWFNVLTHDPRFPVQHSKDPNRTNDTISSGFFCARSELFISGDEDQCYKFTWSQYQPQFMSSCKVLGSSNGLLYGTRYGYREIFICNPITKHIILNIPYPKNGKDIALASDPHNPNLGFTIVAIDVSHENYNDDLMLLKFEVFSSKTREWQASKNNSGIWLPYFNSLLSRKNHAVFIGGKVYWFVAHHVSSIILWFDVEKEVCGVIICPDEAIGYYLIGYSDPSLHVKIGPCDGELSYSRIMGNREIGIWLLREEDDEFMWVKKHRVNLTRVFEDNWKVILMKTCLYPEKYIYQKRDVGRFAYFVHALPYLGGEDVWFTIRFYALPKVFLLNLRTNELKLIKDDVVMEHPFYPFVPTLLPCPT
ncbi:hypothetical protein Scep_020231 [Stephania cephalantha]|uniref:F-box associated beta-propeller type 1 domain-containing protein n=1 Tax=Stephania cephalantha TaxID=152367 RepID=A0AAP0ICV1_9MAGN